jgi:WD40 repeat protein
MRRFGFIGFILFLLPFAALAQQSQDRCLPPDYLIPRLLIGADATVNPGPANNVRDLPSRDGNLLFQVAAGESLTVLEGPTCTEGIVWWQIEYDGQTGWTAESAGGETFISRTLPQIPLPDFNLFPLPRTEADVVLAGGAASYLHFSGGGVLIVAPNGAPNLVDLWDIDTQTRFDMVFDHDATPVSPDSDVIYYSESADESVIATGDKAGRVFVWDASLSPLGNVASETLDGYLPTFATDPDFTEIAVGGCFEEASAGECSLGGAQVFEIATQALLYELGGHPAAITAIAYSADGSIVATAAADGSLYIWDIVAGDLAYEIQTSLNSISDIDFAPDDSVTVGGCVGVLVDCRIGVAEVYSAITGELLLQIPAHAGAITSVDVDTDGARLATAGSDGVVRIWQLSDGAILDTLAFDAQVVKFVPNFNEIVTGSADGLALWTLE